MSYYQRWVRQVPVASRLMLVGVFCLLLGAIGVAMYVPGRDVPNAIGSSCVLALGCVLLWLAFRKRKQERGHGHRPDSRR